jgi:hypothetical protein
MGAQDFGEGQDQLFNSSEKRLARILLLLARFGQNGLPEACASPKLCTSAESMTWWRAYSARFSL